MGRKRKILIKLRLGMVKKRLWKLIFNNDTSEAALRRVERLSHRDFVFFFLNLPLRPALAYAESPHRPNWKRPGGFRVRAGTHIKYRDPGRSTMG